MLSHSSSPHQIALRWFEPPHARNKALQEPTTSQEMKNQPAKCQRPCKLLTFKTSRSATIVLVKVSGEDLGNRRVLQSPGVPSHEWSARETTTPAPRHALAQTQLSWHRTCFSPTHNFFLNWELVNYPNTLQRK